MSQNTYVIRVRVVTEFELRHLSPRIIAQIRALEIAGECSTYGKERETCVINFLKYNQLDALISQIYFLE